MPKVAAIVVTYNRAILLERCLEAINKQTRAADLLIVIDNASTDGTSRWLREEASLKYSNLVVISLKQNTGGAGGFNTGVESAMLRGCDWLWLMDDDGVPANDCLAKMLEHDHGDIIGPLVIDETDHSVLSFGLAAQIHSLEQAVASAKNGLIYGTINPFNGTMIPRRTVERIGNIKREMFIWGDEAEYIHRAAKAQLEIFTVVDAVHYHPSAKAKKIPLIGGRFSVEAPPSGLRRYCRFRNYAYIYFNYDKRRLFTEFVKYSAFYLLSRHRSLADYTEYLIASIDGIFERWGKEVRYFTGKCG